MEDLKNVENLVFEGGGPRAIIAYAGALKELQKHIDFTKIKRVGGNSAGALTAFALAIGYTPDEFYRLVENVDFTQFKDKKKSFLVNLGGFIRSLGWFQGDELQKFLERMLLEKGIHKGITFEYLKNNVYCKELRIATTDALWGRVVIFDGYRGLKYEEVVPAVRASASIPFIFRPVKMIDTLLCDGGVGRNYPIQLYDNIQTKNFKTLGFRVDSIDENQAKEIEENYQVSWETSLQRTEVAEIIPDQMGAVQKLDEIKFYQVGKMVKVALRYANGIVNLMFERANKLHLSDDDWKRTVFINDQGISSKVFSFPPATKYKLMHSGREGVKKYVEWRNTQTQSAEKEQ